MSEAQHIYASSTVALYVELYDSARDQAITTPAEVSFEVQPPGGAASKILALTTGAVTASPVTPGLYIAQYQAMAAGRHLVIARADSADGHRAVSVGGFHAREIPEVSA